MKRIKLSSSKFIATAVLATLLFATGVVADGLPGEYYITQRWRDLLSAYSPANNPAYMTEANYLSVRGAFSPSLGNAFILYEGGAVLPLGLYQSVGFSALGVTSNQKVIAADWDPTTGTIVEGSGTEYSDNHTHMMASWAINPWNKLSVGVNLTVYQTPNFGEPLTGLSMDVGLTYRLLNHSLLGEHLVGFTFQNIISPNVFSQADGADGESEKIELQTQSINAKISWLGKIWDRRIDAGMDIDIKDFTTQAADFGGVIVDEDGNVTKVDGDKKIEFDFNSRVGFWILRMINVYGHLGTGYWGLSGGMNVPTVFGGRDFQAAYQYTSMWEDELAHTHSIYFRGDFGMHREQIYAKKMARMAQLGPGKLYNKALTLYHSGQYWDAFFIFGRILTEHPDFFKNDFVQYYLALCQENMEMREFASQNFNEAISEYSKSPVVPLAQLGLMRVNYRETNYYGVEEEFNKIQSSTTTDSVKQAASYYMGATRMAEEKYSEAITLFSSIPLTHDDYPFAQHSLAISYALTGDINKTMEHLDNVIQFTSTSKAQKEIQNKSYLLLGYLYFDGTAAGGQSLVKAVASLRGVTTDSYYYNDALLGKAWVALKAAKWEDCKLAADELKAKSESDVIKGEAALMIAYYHMVKANYPAAVAILDPASKLLQNYRDPTETDLSTKENTYYDDRGKYYELAQKANELALVNQSSYVIEQIDSLAPVQKSGESDVIGFGKYKDSHKRSNFFGRRAESVLSDVDYALAKAQEIAGSSASSEAAAEAAEDAQELDEEMLELQRQLELLDQ
jgi:TolA-binding protein